MLFSTDNTTLTQQTEIRQDRIDFFRQFAESKNGKCLSDTYINSKTKLFYECKNGHQFFTLPSNTIKGHWCQRCAAPELQAERLNEIKKIAKNHGGECLSERYVNIKTKMQFKCKEEHVWWTVPSLIKNNNWCKRCASSRANDWKRNSIDTFKKIIENRGGTLHTLEYKNSTETKLLVECEKGHQWIAFPGHIKKGSWCRKCNGSFRHELVDIIKLAESRGGKCLSTEYKNDMTNILWQCSENHTWEATPNNIKRNKWCPACSQGIGERISRLFFQRIFGFDFIKIRPSWLRSSKGFCLELDGYCKELNLAFEHQGRQHYSKVKFFSKRISYDEEKRILCKQHGITLIEIPEVLNDTKIKDLKAFIIQECERNNVELPSNITQIEITPFEIYTYTKNQERRLLAQKAEAKIILKGGTLIETHLSDNGLSFKVLCSKNHQWSITNANLNFERWCPHCRKETSINIQLVKQTVAKEKLIKRQELLGKEIENRKVLATVKEANPKTDRIQLSIQKILDIAKSKDGVCVSKKYFNDTTPLIWRCSKGHEWTTMPKKIKNGSWCPKCAGNTKSSIEDIIELIQKRGGKCFLETYQNRYTKIDIECEQGHKFISTAKSVKRGNWCPKCAIDERARKRKLCIDDMHLVAKRKQGKCLSLIYTDINTKLIWECVNGHQFSSKPGNVKSGKWCPKCAIKRIVDKAVLERKRIIEQILIDRKGKIIAINSDYSRISEATWQCGKGHIWTTRIANILVGHWCAKCSNKDNWNNKRTTIQEINQLAKSKGGACLSMSYENPETKIEFICKEGHTWTALWHNIKSKGCWCPQCAAKLRWDNRRLKQQLQIWQ
jgi:hypothetical protein